MHSILKIIKFSFLLIVLLAINIFGFAQNKDSTIVYELGSVSLKGERVNNDSAKVVSAKMMELQNVNTLNEAIALLPSVANANVGDRNEGVAYIRGFDLRQVPLFVDGIPVYVPFDGYVDLARFTTYDLSQVEVSMGGSSVLFGANTLGGAINLVGRKPTKKFETNGMIGWMSGGSRVAINTGSKVGKFYFQVSASQFKRDFYPLSNEYEAGTIENGGRRDNSFNNDQKLNVKVGYAPNSKQEHSLNLIIQKGEKGNPLYAGNDSLNPRLTRPRYWYWPYWNKNSLYSISKFQLGDKQSLQTRVYYDEFENQLKSYDDDKFNTQTKRYAFTSNYFDKTIGGNATYTTKKINKHLVKAAIHYKYDLHQEQDEGDPLRSMSDYTMSLGIEDYFNPIPNLSILVGVGVNQRTSNGAENIMVNNQFTQFKSNNSSALNAMFNTEYDLKKQGTKLHLNVAKTSRFATLKDRYSYRLGTALPNPDLNAEQALNIELGLDGKIGKNFGYHVAIFNSEITNTIQQVDRVFFDTAGGGTWLAQQQNTGKSRFYGAEVQVKRQFNKSLEIGVNYSFIERKNLSNPTVLFTNVPKHNLFGYAKYTLKKDYWLNINTRYNSVRTSQSYGVSADAFIILNTKIHGKLYKDLGIDFGIGNILDANYAYSEGFPEPGRNYFVSLVWDIR